MTHNTIIIIIVCIISTAFIVYATNKYECSPKLENNYSDNMFYDSNGDFKY